jgi:hypothetical protein
MGVGWTRVLIGYSAVLTTILSGAMVTQAVGGPAKAVFQEIDVQRINVREGDGTLRLVISNTDQSPGIIYKGTDYPHPNRKTAGMIFFNEEGTENGGLSFGGRRDAQGRVVGSGGHLSFDQFEQDQVVALNQSEDPSGNRRAGLTITDRPDKAMPFAEMADYAKADPARRKAMLDRWIAEDRIGAKTRLFLGKTPDRASSLVLSDVEGRARILLQVRADGEASIQFLDAAGKVVKTVSPSAG